MQTNANQIRPQNQAATTLTSTTSLGTPQELDALVASEHNGIGIRVTNLEARCQGLLSRLITNRGLAKVVEQNNIAEVKDWHQYRRDLFKLATDTQLERIHEACLRMVRETKVEARQEFSAFVMEKQEELRRVCHAKRDTFLADMDAAYTQAERYAHRPALADRAVAAIEREIEQYSNWLEGLNQNFLNIAEEGVNTYRKMT